MSQPRSRQPAQAAAARQSARYSSVDRQSRQADAVRQRCYSRSWRIALLERFWQARHPPRYAAYLIPSSPSFPHSSQLRLGLAYQGIEQQRTGSLMLAELVQLAQLKSICDAVLLAEDEDLSVGVQIAQSYGVRV